MSRITRHFDLFKDHNRRSDIPSDTLLIDAIIITFFVSAHDNHDIIQILIYLFFALQRFYIRTDCVCH